MPLGFFLLILSCDGIQLQDSEGGERLPAVWDLRLTEIIFVRGRQMLRIPTSCVDRMHLPIRKASLKCIQLGLRDEIGVSLGLRQYRRRSSLEIH